MQVMVSRKPKRELIASCKALAVALVCLLLSPADDLQICRGVPPWVPFSNDVHKERAVPTEVRPYKSEQKTPVTTVGNEMSLSQPLTVRWRYASEATLNLTPAADRERI